MSEPFQPQNKEQLLDYIRSERKLLEQTLAGLNRNHMLQPIESEEGKWSVKDILAHISAWERRMIHWVAQYKQGEDPPLPQNVEQIDQLNRETHLRFRDRPLEEIRSEFQSSYKAALETAQSLSEEELFDPEYFVHRRGRPLWIMVAANTGWHYQEHRHTIQQWLDG